MREERNSEVVEELVYRKGGLTRLLNSLPETNTPERKEKEAELAIINEQLQARAIKEEATK